MPEVDVVHEIKQGVPLPFPDNTFSKIYLYDLVEHLSGQVLPWTLAETHRIAEPNAQVSIRYPHFSSPNAYNDTTHVRVLGLEAFDHFDPDTKYGGKYQYYKMFGREFPFKIESNRPTFPRGLSTIGRSLHAITGNKAYEWLLARLIPIGGVDLRMRVLKYI